MITKVQNRSEQNDSQSTIRAQLKTRKDLHSKLSEGFQELCDTVLKCTIDVPKMQDGLLPYSAVKWEMERELKTAYKIENGKKAQEVKENGYADTTALGRIRQVAITIMKIEVLEGKKNDAEDTAEFFGLQDSLKFELLGRLESGTVLSLQRVDEPSELEAA